MEVVDLFCGLGGFAAGALEVEGCSVVLGVDQVCHIRGHDPYLMSMRLPPSLPHVLPYADACPSFPLLPPFAPTPQDPVPLKLFAANTRARVTLATLGEAGDPIELPPPSTSLHVHVMPAVRLSNSPLSEPAAFGAADAGAPPLP